ncbi:MAG: 30S ribosomal protein S8e [Nanoarchaeota archaeon]|nr:30S ribosomal protein S8e [Nanoarchaeota archaeon]MBU1134905.1 30S ribosomal protein S8e [Nanoarchaeota archaeon]MBU2520248.1 30S ribosomal protein S8e [Nanoarchaeota archaeon]
MAIWHLKSKRKATSGLVRKNRKKKAFERGTIFLETKIGERRAKTQRKRGGTEKTKLLRDENVNVFNPKSKKIEATKIKSVEENTANPHYVRRNILTRGAIIKTDIGLARITSRPGQVGVINAILLEGEKK